LRRTQRAGQWFLLWRGMGPAGRDLLRQRCVLSHGAAQPAVRGHARVALSVRLGGSSGTVVFLPELGGV